jgi:Tfp pilus assembly protein PilO
MLIEAMFMSILLNLQAELVEIERRLERLEKQLRQT